MLAIGGEKPDRLPVSIHQWQSYHLDKYMGGKSDIEAFRTVGLDAQIQHFEEMDQFWVVGGDFGKIGTPDWQDDVRQIDSSLDHRITHHTIHTPEGKLTYKTEGDQKTTWITEHLIKRNEDIFLIKK